MEPRFGYDFSRVRVHTGARAAESAQAVQARAYTLGRDVVFASGEYAPATPRGQRLLAHELTHVAQQGAARRAVLQRRPTTETGTSAPAYTEPGWKFINKPGIVRVEETTAKERGARLRPEPNTSPASTAKSVHLDENTHVIVVAENSDPKSSWRFVHVTEGRYIAYSGYVASWLIHTSLPDPGAIR